MTNLVGTIFNSHMSKLREEKATYPRNLLLSGRAHWDVNLGFSDSQVHRENHEIMILIFIMGNTQSQVCTRKHEDLKELGQSLDRQWSPLTKEPADKEKVAVGPRAMLSAADLGRIPWAATVASSWSVLTASLPGSLLLIENVPENSASHKVAGNPQVVHGSSVV